MNNRLRNKWIKRLFPIIAFLLLAPWPVAYAYDTNANAAQDAVRVEVAEALAQPVWTVFGSAIGGVTHPVDLFRIDATQNRTDIVVTLYLTNAQELVNHYRFLTLKVGVYVESHGEWQKATLASGEVFPETFITLRNGQVSFVLPGYARYQVTIDSGGFYAASASLDGRGLSPQFYLEVN